MSVYCIYIDTHTTTTTTTIGSYNPLTRMHVRMFLLAKQFLESRTDYVVLGSLLGTYLGAYLVSNNFISEEFSHKVIAILLIVIAVYYSNKYLFTHKDSKNMLLE